VFHHLKLVRGLAVLALGMSAAGCIVVHDHGDGPPPPPNEDQEVVDQGQALTTDPGSGVAILLEYEGGTDWNIVVTCDTLKSQVSCPFDLYVRANNVSFTGAIDLESNDYVDQSASEIHASLDTDIDVDGLTFSTGDGDSIELEVYVDGNDAAPYVFWVGNGVTHAGALTNPAIFIPN
jgi:hypothetical protein